MKYPAPVRCAVCSHSLEITRLTCPHCETELTGHFVPCKFCALDDRQKLFLDAFLRARGSIKEVERMLSISYPTVKGLLEDLVTTLYPEDRQSDVQAENLPSPSSILDRLAAKEITTDQAIDMLSQHKIKGGSSK